MPSSSTWGLTINEPILPVGRFSEYDEHEFPSFDAISKSIQDPLPQVPSFGKTITFGIGPQPQLHMLPATFRSNTCSTSQVKKDAKLSNSPITAINLQSNSTFPNNSATPIADSILVQALQQHEVQYRKPNEAGGSKHPQRNMNANFASGNTVLLAQNRKTCQSFFSTKIENEFYNLMTGLLSKLDYRLAFLAHSVIN